MAKNIEINWFKHIKTLDELKAEFKKLTKTWHPDINNNPNATKFSQEINVEFEWMLENYKFAPPKNLNESTNFDVQEEIKFSQNYITVIKELSKFPTLKIELVGNWLWVSGGTFPLKDELNRIKSKCTGFDYFGGKKCGLIEMYLSRVPINMANGVMTKLNKNMALKRLNRFVKGC